MANPFRPPAERESHLMARLLLDPFPGRDELREQLSQCDVRGVDEYGSLEFRLFDATPSPVIDQIPLEGEVEDTNGEIILLQLHVRRGLLSLLDVTKLIGGGIFAPLAIERIRVLHSIGGFCPPKGFLAPAYLPPGYAIKSGGRSRTDAAGRSNRALVTIGPKGRPEEPLRIDEIRISVDGGLPAEGAPLIVRGNPSRLISTETFKSLLWIERGTLLEISGNAPIEEISRIAESMYSII